MTTAATIAARLTLDTSQYEKSLATALSHAKRFQQQLQTSGSQIGNWGSSINNAIGNISMGLKNAGRTLTMGVTLPLVGAGIGLFVLAKQALTVGAEFDTQMKNIQSISRQTDDEIKLLSREFVNMSRDIRQTTDDAVALARGFYFIQSAGFAGEAGMEVLRVSTKAATAGLSDTDTASKAILAVLNSYGMTAWDAAHVSDVLFRTVDLGVLTFGDLASQLGDVVNTSATVGVNIETVGAALAQMTRKGISTAESVTALNQLLLQFISPSKKMQDAAESIGLGKGFMSIDTLRELGLQGALEKMVEMDPDALLKIFGDNVRALKGALSLGGKNMPGFTDMLEQMGNAAGRTDQAFETQTKSIEAYSKNIKNTLTALQISFTTAFKPGLTRAAGSFSKFLNNNFGRIGGLFIRLGEIWDRVVTWLVNILETKGDKLFDFFNRLIDALPQVWENLKKIFGPLYEIIRLLVTGDFRGGIFGLQEDDALIGFLFDLRDMFTGGGLAGMTTFILTLGGLGPVLSTIGTLLPLVGPLLLGLATGISTNGPQIAAFFTTLATQLPIFVGKLQELGVVVGPVMQKIYDAFINMDPNTMLWIVGILGGLVALAPLFIVLGGAISGVGAIIGVFQTILIPFVTFLLVTAIPAIAAFIAANAAWLLPLALITLAVFILFQAVRSNFMGIRDIILQVATAIVGAFDTIQLKFAEMTNRFNLWRPPAWLSQIGGMAAGMVPGLGGIVRGAQTLVGGARSTVAAGAAGTGLFRPSSVTTPIGAGGATAPVYNVVVNNPKVETAEASVRKTLKSISYIGVPR